MNPQHKKIQVILHFIDQIQKKLPVNADVERIFSALLSPSEIDAISQRIHVLEQLYLGKSQREISEELGVGVATSTRGNRMLKENLDLFKKVFKPRP